MNINEELSKIKSEKRGEDVRDAIISALKKMAGSFLAVSKKITKNGTYKASDDSADGYSEIVVDVTPNLGTKTIQQNGTFAAADDSFDGYSSVTVDVKGGGDVKLVEKTVTENGTYTALDEGADGYSAVTVNIEEGIAKAFNSNIDKQLVDVDFGTAKYIPKHFADEFKPYLHSVTGKNVNVINEYAFAGCVGLVSAIFPAFNSFVNGSAGRQFCNCIALKEVDLGNYDSNIWPYAFDGDSSLETVKLGGSPYHIYEKAFNVCHSLQQFPDFSRTNNIDDYAFSECYEAGGEVVLPKIKSIGFFAFHSCKKITSVRISGSPSINSQAFAECSNLTDIYVEDVLDGDLNGPPWGATKATIHYKSDGYVNIKSVNLEYNDSSPATYTVEADGTAILRLIVEGNDLWQKGTVEISIQTTKDGEYTSLWNDTSSSTGVWSGNSNGSYFYRHVHNFDTPTAIYGVKATFTNVYRVSGRMRLQVKEATT